MRALVPVFTVGRSLDAGLHEVLSKVEPARDRALAQDLCYGVLRWAPRLEAIAGLLIQRPLKRRDTDIYCLVLVGLYQLVYTRVPAHAAVAETVQAAEVLGKGWARGMVNAVLRRFQREAAALLAQADAREDAAFAHPAWLLERLKWAWPKDWRRIVQANNERPPMWLRVNLRHCTRERYLNDLRDAGIAAVAGGSGPAAVLLETPVDVQQLPGFKAGRVSVQDAAAQLAAPLLELRGGQRVLDACAAPGGKSAHILESEPALSALIAVDEDPARLARVRETLDRLRLSASLVRADAAGPPTWWDQRPFDRILLDVPCSASGVIRRHPDIKRLRRPGDMDTLVARQRRLLDAAWSMLAEGGMLLYSTCSIMPEENADQVAAFLADHSDATERSIDAVWGRAVRVGRQVLPGDDGMDGFYYARLEKNTPG